jgi:hypothetical protein
MNFTASPRSRVAAAQARVDAARLELTGHVAALRAIVQHRRNTLIVGSGLVAGLAVGLLPIRFWGGFGGMLASIGALAARSMLTPMVAGALLARQGQPTGDLPKA